MNLAMYREILMGPSKRDEFIKMEPRKCSAGNVMGGLAQQVQHFFNVFQVGGKACKIVGCEIGAYASGDPPLSPKKFLGSMMLRARPWR